MIAIEVDNLKKSFGRKIVHNGVTFSVKDNEIFVIMGPSGTGKSVLLKQIAALMKPDSGTITVYGKNVEGMTDKERLTFRETVTYVFQNGALFDSIPIWYNVAFFLIEKKGMSDRKARQKAEYYLSILGLSGTGDLYPSEISGGMRKRVAIARALCVDPKIMLFDEPTSGLDPIMTSIMNNLILNLKIKFKKTCVVVSHDVSSSFKIADRLAILWNGRIVESGTVDEIKASDNPIVKQFINGIPEGPITVRRE